MKRIIIAFAVIALTFSCNSNESTGTKKDVKTQPPTTTNHSNNKKNIKEISVTGTSITQNVSKEKFAELIAKNNGTILDVRTPGECAKGIIEGAVNINLYDNKFNAMAESQLKKDKPVYVYCQSGARSSKAMYILKKLGFKEVYNLQGGYSGWNK